MRVQPRLAVKLRVVLMGLGLLCSTVSAFSQEEIGEITQPITQQEAVQQSPSGEQQIAPPETAALIERLNRAEQEIKALRSQLPALPDRISGHSPEVEGMGGEVQTDYSDDSASRLSSLEKQFQDLKDGLSKPKFPTVQINGFFQADTMFFDQSPNNRATVGDIQDGAAFRRTRLSAKGSVIENVNYMIQMDFAFFGRPSFTDVYMEVTQVPWLGTVRVGQWKQPFGLEVVTSVRYQTFMERSLNFQSWEPFRHLGTGFFNYSENEMSTWAASGYRAGQDQYGDDIGDNGGWALAARGTHLFWYEDCNGSLDYLHVGGAYNRVDPSNDRFRFATIPEAFLGAFGAPAGAVPGTSKVVINSISNGTPPFVDTGTQLTNYYQVFGTEGLWVRGPLSVQSEVQWNLVQQPGGAQLLFPGSYLFASYFLTGESRPYDRKIGALDRVKPNENFMTRNGCFSGRGAWEVAGRWSYIDLNDGNVVRGGHLNDFTAGLNWYLNPYTKFQFNYIKALLVNPTTGKSDADIFGLRCQTDF